MSPCEIRLDPLRQREMSHIVSGVFISRNNYYRSSENIEYKNRILVPKIWHTGKWNYNLVRDNTASISPLFSDIILRSQFILPVEPKILHILFLSHLN